MAVISRQNCAGLTDPGRKRENNEDRFHADPDRGIFFVIDGVGGQAAGEKAADTAYNLLRARLERPTGTPADRVREAITIANNEIFRLSKSNEAWRGMACVLTVVIVEDGQLTVGQVGDSRLYLIEPGEIRKVTHDHSPVGEREDRGEIDELTAMRHPRRNEVYRDVGSEDHAPDDPDFIEDQHRWTSRLDRRCSSARTGLATWSLRRRFCRSWSWPPVIRVAITQALIDAANAAGGKDNVTVVFVEGDRFAAESSPTVIQYPESTSAAATRRQLDFEQPVGISRPGLLAGCAIAVFALKPHWLITPEGEKLGFGAIREPRIWRINADISSALQNARPGETVLVAPGQYHEQVALKEGVNLISEQPRQAIIRAAGIAVQANELHSGRFEGFRVTGEDQNNLSVGIQLNGFECRGVGQRSNERDEAAVECLGESTGVFRANAFYGQSRSRDNRTGCRADAVCTQHRHRERRSRPPSGSGNPRRRAAGAYRKYDLE